MSIASSNVNDVIRAVLNFFILFFLQEDFTRTKSTKSILSEDTNRRKKTQISKQVRFFTLDVFYAHKNAAFFKIFVHLYAFYAFCACEMFSQKKQKTKQNYPNDLIYITTGVNLNGKK